jgi:hypothetical protein
MSASGGEAVVSQTSAQVRVCDADECFEIAEVHFFFSQFLHEQYDHKCIGHIKDL